MIWWSEGKSKGSSFRTSFGFFCGPINHVGETTGNINIVMACSLSKRERERSDAAAAAVAALASSCTAYIIRITNGTEDGYRSQRESTAGVRDSSWLPSSHRTTPRRTLLHTPTPLLIHLYYYSPLAIELLRKKRTTRKFLLLFLSQTFIHLFPIFIRHMFLRSGWVN